MPGEGSTTINHHSHSLPPGHSRTGNIFVCRENVLVPVIKRDRCRILRFTVLHETEIGISNKLLPRFPPLRFFFFFFPPPRFSSSLVTWFKFSPIDRKMRRDSFLRIFLILSLSLSLPQKRTLSSRRWKQRWWNVLQLLDGTLAGLQAGAEFPRNNLDRAKGSGIKIHKARVSRPFHDYTPFKREAGFRTTTHGGADDGTKISRSGKSLLIHFENGIQRRDRFLHAYHVEAIRWKSVLFRRDRFSFFSFPRGTIKISRVYPTDWIQFTPFFLSVRVD